MRVGAQQRRADRGGRHHARDPQERRSAPMSVASRWVWCATSCWSAGAPRSPSISTSTRRRGQRAQSLDGVAQRPTPGHEPDRADIPRGQGGGEERGRGAAEVDGELRPHPRGRPRRGRPGGRRRWRSPCSSSRFSSAGTATMLRTMSRRSAWASNRETRGWDRRRRLGDLGLAQAPRVVEPRHLRDETQPVHVRPVASTTVPASTLDIRAETSHHSPASRCRLRILIQNRPMLKARSRAATKPAGMTRESSTWLEEGQRCPAWTRRT